MGEGGLDAVAGVVGERQRDGAGGRDRTVMREARADLGELIDQLGRHAARRAACSGCSARAGCGPGSSRRRASHPPPSRDACAASRRVTVNSSVMIGAGPFSRARSSAASQPARASSRATLSVKITEGLAPYFMPSIVIAEPRPRKPMPWRRLRRISSRCRSSGRPLTSTTLSSMRVNTFTTRRNSSQSKSASARERMAHETREIDRAEQARAVGRQRLLAAGIGRADVLAEPVVVHLVDAVDQHESRLGEIVGRGHDHVPHAPRGQRLVDLAGDQALFVDDVVVLHRPFAPDVAVRVVQVGLLDFVFLAPERKRELPLRIGFHRVHEFVGDQQRQVELAQPPRFALDADELHGIGMSDVEGAHLCAAPAAGGGHREAHLVVDIHERERPGRVGAGAGHVGAARPQRREFVANAAAGLEREPRLVHAAQDVIHRIADGARDGAVDRGSGGLVIERARIRGHTSGRHRALAQRPQEALVPLLADFLALHFRERARDTLVRVVHALVDGRAVFRGQPIFLVPDIE